jgi:hypothetical protein
MKKIAVVADLQGSNARLGLSSGETKSVALRRQYKIRVRKKELTYVKAEKSSLTAVLHHTTQSLGLQDDGMHTKRQHYDDGCQGIEEKASEGPRRRRYHDGRFCRDDELQQATYLRMCISRCPPVGEMIMPGVDVASQLPN